MDEAEGVKGVNERPKHSVGTDMEAVGVNGVMIWTCEFPGAKFIGDMKYCEAVAMGGDVAKVVEV